MRALLDNLSQDQATSYGLVLSSSGISHRVKRGEKGWDLLVEEGDYDEALRSLDEYLEENEDLPPAGESPPEEYGWTFAGIWVSVMLVAWHITITMGSDGHTFAKAYGSSAMHILRGELHRTVTSLMIHASPLHLAGNVLGIGLFGTAVCSITGWGVGWLMILSTGVSGNLINALLHRTGHVSVGASTAVFGAIGILAAHQFMRKFRLPGQRMRAWLPLAGGVALLGLLGGGQHVDLTAHLFGFVTGILLGGLYTFSVKGPLARGYQFCGFLVTMSVLVMSWMGAFGLF
jgi:membrane associated rhomboid family serine protease